MKKTLLILSFILLSVVSFAQRQRTTAVFDADTTTRPKAGFYGIGVRANNIYFVPPTGNNIRLANYSLFTGLTTNYLSKWNGSKLVNSAIYESGGNVGIGTEIPNATLQTKGTAGSPNNTYFATTDSFSWLSSGSILRLGHGTFSGNTYGIIDNLVAGGTLYGNLTLQQGGGNVGVGTVSPTNKLHVLSSSGTAAMIESSTSQTFYGLKSNTGGVVYFGNTNGGDYTIQTPGSGYSDKLYITSSGNVGIGTTSPSAKLDVYASASLLSNYNYISTGGYSRYQYNGTSIADLGNANQVFSGGAIGDFGISSRAGKLQIGTSSTIAITIDNSQGVGIGTTTPTSKLQVVGLPVYADNTAATIGGLTEGAFYRTVLGVLMVVY